MKLKIKLIIILAVSAVLNAACAVLGAQPVEGSQIPVFTGLLLLLTPGISCILAGILAGSNVKREFWLVLVPAAVNLTVTALMTGVQSGWIEIAVFLGILPGLIAMGITALIARKKR